MRHCAYTHQAQPLSDRHDSGRVTPLPERRGDGWRHGPDSQTLKRVPETPPFKRNLGLNVRKSENGTFSTLFCRVPSVRALNPTARGDVEMTTFRN